MSDLSHVADGPAGLLREFRRIIESRTSPVLNTRRREAFLMRPLSTLRLEAVELAPVIKDEDGNEVVGSTVPQPLPHRHPMIKEEPSTNRIAHREVRIRVRSDGRPDDFHAGKAVTWSMEPLFVRPSADGEGAESPEFRGDWQLAAEAHRNRFEPPNGFTTSNFQLLSQDRASTIVDATGHTAIRVNLPPVAFNSARISVHLEGESKPIDLLDLEVPGIIVIDPGHGGTTNTGGSNHNNATSYGDPTGHRTLEKELTLIFGLKLQNYLVRHAADLNHMLRIILTRGEDENVGIRDRAAFSATYGADIFFSIHFNGNDLATVRGPETLIETIADGNVNFDEDMALAERVQAALTTSVPNAQQPGERGYRGVKTYSPPPSGVYRDQHLKNIRGQPNSRACLAEIEFITNPDVERDLVSGGDADANQDAVTETLAQALLDDLMRQP